MEEQYFTLTAANRNLTPRLENFLGYGFDAAFQSEVIYYCNVKEEQISKVQEKILFSAF